MKTSNRDGGKPIGTDPFGPVKDIALPALGRRFCGMARRGRIVRSGMRPTMERTTAREARLRDA
jgi:hypothetical protein